MELDESIAVDPVEARLLRELWINDHLDQADLHFSRANFRAAIRSLGRIVSRYPDSVEARDAEEMIRQIRESAGDFTR